LVKGKKRVNTQLHKKGGGKKTKNTQAPMASGLDLGRTTGRERERTEKPTKEGTWNL